MEPPQKTRRQAPQPVGTFDDLFVTEYAKMVALAASVCGSRADAEDIAQEAMTRLDRNWTAVRDLERPGAWLRRVTINLALSQKRRLFAEAKAVVRFRAARPQLAAAPAGDEAVWAAVAKLPKQQRAAVSLHFLEDRTITEIAEILEISASTARVHLHRARNTLRGHFAQAEEREESL